MTSSPSRVRRWFLRDFEAGGNLDAFLVAAVSAVLLIRFLLNLAGYPQLGGGQLHIAHMLWGGILMLAAVILALSFLDRGARNLAAWVGGLGFGTFIDEVGKFLTRDNDYFFQPAVAVIYAVFLVLYLAMRSIHREGIATPEEYLVNALQEISELAVHDLSPEERSRALRYLEAGGSGDPLTAGLRKLLTDASLVAGRPGVAARWRARGAAFYRRITGHPWFTRGLVGFFIAQLAVGGLFVVLLLDPRAHARLQRIHWPRTVHAHATDGFAGTALVCSSILATVFVGAGVFLIRRSRLRGYRMFQRSILVTLLFGEVFLFYREQWGALIGLAFNLLLFGALRLMIEAERDLEYHRTATGVRT